MNIRPVEECDECGSMYFPEISRMDKLCPECSHMLYGYTPCLHTFADGRCSKCHWDGSVSEFCKEELKRKDGSQ
jgi:predicted RNA-binding Zn-ribbon protein involved in translation (DUF1610 family)